MPPKTTKDNQGDDNIDVSDDGESYEPSNDENPEPGPEADDEDHYPSDLIDANDYVETNHPLRPKRASQILNEAKQLARLRHHYEYWWDVLLAMNKRAKMNKGNSATNEALREEVIQLAEEAREHRRERAREASERKIAEARVVQLTEEVEKLQKQRKRDEVLIAHLSQKKRPAGVPDSPRIGVDFTPSRTASENVEPAQGDRARTTPMRFSSSLGHLHDNSKFPDAPVFSGDRTAFDSWKDKVEDKLNNSAAQYPTDYHRIAYIKSRTDGEAYQQIRARCQPSHARTFRDAEDVLNTLEKIYGDKNKRSRAINELRTLRMGKKTFDDFYANFARCAAEIGYTDDALVPLLENAISDELARQVIGLQKPFDYYDLVDFYREIDHQLRDYDKRTSNRFNSSRPTDRARTARTTATTDSKPEGYRPNATERTLLAQHGRCYKCGEHGHRIGECKNPQMKEMPRLSARPRNNVNKATLDSDDDETIVEGNAES